MFSTATGGKAKVTKTKIALTSALSLAAFILPVALAGPAQAATTQFTQPADTQFRGCTMEQPLKPNSIWQRSYMRYDVSLFCAGGKTVQVHQQFLEYDFGNPNDIVGEKIHSPYKYIGTRSEKFIAYAATPNTEAGAEEVYQRARFRVKLLNNAWSDWSRWEYSPYVLVPQP